MLFSQKLSTHLTDASAKALATMGPHGINVVPVSMLKVNHDSIWLFDFFMEKTVANIQSDATVALTAWSGMTGVQIKAAVTYVTAGEQFEAAVAWVQTQNPERVTKGLLILEPNEMYDVSPGGAFEPEDLTV